jgi:hypothetical protein
MRDDDHLICTGIGCISLSVHARARRHPMSLGRRLYVTLAHLHNYSDGTVRVEVIPLPPDRALVVLEARVCGQRLWTTYPIAAVDPDPHAICSWLEAREEQASRIAFSRRGLAYMFHGAAKVVVP